MPPHIAGAIRMLTVTIFLTHLRVCRLEGFGGRASVRELHDSSNKTNTSSNDTGPFPPLSALGRTRGPNSGWSSNTHPAVVASLSYFCAPKAEVL